MSRHAGVADRIAAFRGDSHSSVFCWMRQLPSHDGSRRRTDIPEMRAGLPKLTAFELQIMKKLWTRGRSSVREIQ